MATFSDPSGVKQITPEERPTTSTDPAHPGTSSAKSRLKPINIITPKKNPFKFQCMKCLYNKEDKTICGRTCISWISIICYSIMYLIFLCTYTMVFLYGSLCAVKATVDFESRTDFQAFSQNGIGLTATPVSVLGGYPLIWYKIGDAQGHKKYIDAIDKLMYERSDDGVNRTNFGPCARPPYGYGDKPCIIVRINNLINWVAKPLTPETAAVKNAPNEVKSWITSKNNMLWLHCSGYHSYDKEHIKSIKYYPDPPGFDADKFPLDMKTRAPLVAVQISDFTLGISLAIECKLWYENGESSVEFMLYVTP
ncbi:sodium/potassium-transporting ATPase subunit beta-1-like [Amyelois transitella]|uniref:sodium/potassium-transporting ATPase subunit beta-1-like n=1 Tax=Amyelois transitella TaxID=680683 RepID=UPI00067D4FE4|nr:sodium/potassium-transporting ATPase subunit beta-1-like [Amyelois transitella]